MNRKFKQYIFISSHVDRVEATVNAKLDAVVEDCPDQELEFQFSDIIFRNDSMMVNQFIVVYQITE